MALVLPSLRVAPEANGAAINSCKGGLVNTLLTANTPKIISIPTYGTSDLPANYVIFSSTEDFWLSYIYGANSDSLAELTDLATNGAFASDTSWTKGTGWTIASGVATSSGVQSADADLSQTPTVVVPNQWYYVTFTVTAYTAGNVTAVVGGTEGTDRASAATFAEYIKAGSDGTLALRADLDFVGSVDNFSAVPAAHIPTTDDLTGRGSELNPDMRTLGGVIAVSLVSSAAAKISMAFYRG